MLSTPKSKGELFLASSLRDGLEDNDIRQVKTLLLSKEADPNVLIPTHGISPFHLVIGNESEAFAEEVTKLFLRHGGNPNVRSADGMTPVHVAAAWGRVRVLELLLANGGDPLCLDDDARSPFHYAFDGAYYDAVSILGKYCGTNQDEEKDDDEEPKYKLTLAKILINKGDCVAEYVPSDVGASGSISVKTETSATSGSSEEDAGSVKQEPQASPQAETGNSSRSSTPDEFSHLDTDNITLRRNHKRRGNSNVDAPNLDIAFGERNVEEERLLVGQIINRLSNTFINEPAAAAAIAKDTATSTVTSASSSSSRTTTASQAIANTRRRYLPPPKYHSCNLPRANTTPQRLHADTSIISKSPNFRIPQKTPTTCERKKYRNDEGTPTPSRSAVASKPAQVRVGSASSTPKRKQYRSRLSGSVKLPKTEKMPLTTRTTEKKPVIFDKTYCKDRFGAPSYSPDTEISDRRGVRPMRPAKNVAVKLADRMYDDNLENDIHDSPPASKFNAKSPSSNLLVRQLKPLRIYNNIKADIGPENTKRCNVNASQENTEGRMNTAFPAPKQQQRTPTTPTAGSVKFQRKQQENAALFLGEQTEKLRDFFESPGSSNPESVTRLEYSSLIAKKAEKKWQDQQDEDTKIWIEIEEALKKRCGTPPASVSILDTDNSPNSSLSSPENVIGTTFYSDYGSEDASTSEFYEASMNIPKLLPGTATTIQTSRPCTESFVSVDEEYMYEDADEGVAFIERRLCVMPSSSDVERNQVASQLSWIERFEDLSLLTSDCDASTLSRDILGKSCVDDKTLRERLRALGEIPGPITKTTFNVYLKRLYRLEDERKILAEPTGDGDDSDESPRRSLALRRSDRQTIIPRTIPDFLLSTDWTTKLEWYRTMEEQAFKEYATANPKRKYRGGISKSSFCYLLLDPRVTRDLPRSGLRLNVEDRWARFLEGIFYVGKGKAARPAAHLYDAFGVWSKRKRTDNLSRKIRRILDIWEDRQGVVCLHVFSHTMLEEACTREAAMIDALETVHLTNCVRGTYYGYTTTMNTQEKRSLGKYLLYKAMEIFMHEGERQLFPRNVIL